MVTVRLPISFEALIQAILCLDLDDKRKLVTILETQIAEEQDLIEQELEEPIAASPMYQADDYDTIDEYVGSRSRQIS
jgi:hypothetical protein